MRGSGEYEVCGRRRVETRFAVSTVRRAGHGQQLFRFRREDQCASSRVSSASTVRCGDWTLLGFGMYGERKREILA
jgi:hypothetical protein